MFNTFIKSDGGESKQESNTQSVTPPRVIRLSKSLPPLPTQTAVPHRIVTKKVARALRKALSGCSARPSRLAASSPLAAEYTFRLDDTKFEILRKHILSDYGLNIDGNAGIYTVSVSTEVRENIGGRYGPDKDRYIRIPDYAKSKWFGDWSQQKVLDAAKDIPGWDWHGYPDSNAFGTRRKKLSARKMQMAKRQFQRLGLKLEASRETYYSVSYNVVPFNPKYK